jgi:hypothetical protein
MDSTPVVETLALEIIACILSDIEETKSALC